MCPTVTKSVLGLTKLTEEKMWSGIWTYVDSHHIDNYRYLTSLSSCKA